ncbi:MAG TPA: Asp-tRNA(Asn)/Glu-tRNA(Gln) amidotransferase subunit GatB, partial [Polyangia bacterium]|nr:Asp-tRNA(Asn)/Glu-tRNA(Gln) amidotransferase subunit GatB [Polyangia bacterium]
MSALDKYEVVIGLEVHVHLATKSKIFSSSSTAFGAEPNASTDVVTLGLPGTLPVLNKTAVEMAVRLGLAVGSRIRPRSRFARKHYFYPDLPKGFQVSQYDEPICEGGAITFRLHGERRQVRLTRIHMEEDAGKLTHAQGGVSLVDYNRAAVPLCEVVSEPDLRSADEAAEYVRAMRTLVRYLGISDGNMEEGSLRCDANVSLRPRGETKLGTKAELKNINSFKNVRDAIEHEVRRQATLLDRGERIVQETRLWDANKQQSASMRSKEHAHDYRYFPEPDLLPLVISDEWREAIRAQMPELPAAKRRRFVERYGIPEYDAHVLTLTPTLGNYFEEVARLSGQPKAASNWVMGDLTGALKAADLGIEQSPVSATQLAELVKLVAAGELSGKLAKEIFPKMFASGKAASEIIA